MKTHAEKRDTFKRLPLQQNSDFIDVDVSSSFVLDSFNPRAEKCFSSIFSFSRSSFSQCRNSTAAPVPTNLFLFNSVELPLDCARTRFPGFFSAERRIIQLELGKPEEQRKAVKRVNGIFWILLINIGVYVADHVFQVPLIKELYLYHYNPAWYQFITSTFCHFNWSHLSSNLFFLYIFGKLVEEEEGNFALWISYILTGAGANLVSWLVLPRNAVSIGASGAVFGLFAVSVLVKMSWDWRKILEVLILGQFVVEKVMEAAQASASLGGSFRGGAMQNVNHIAHLSGALIGVVLIWLLSSVPTPTDEK
ncbi:rhomboid-like protein 11, chloroplastic isoform X1 [Salvia splendens]|uniref:rhomboid-like protein 11, chloroplastic isoform X1 n=1 Tax=Salvia splendens TaxID=180675 RepID=UPI001C278222|nr:rhomboid-like protein 11, chloroplastic isoform X1 [Salvia splendens]